MRQEYETASVRNPNEIFIELRPALLKLAGHILGSQTEAEDMVQEAYLRWAQSPTREVRAPKPFLTTIVTRLCLNRVAMARVRLKHEDAPLRLEGLSSKGAGPEEHVELADAISQAFAIVLARLSPTERAVFLLREAFEFDYGDIASITARSEENCRQILKRARERLAAKARTAPPPPALDREQNRRVVSEFLNAAETGEVDGLLQLLSDSASLAPAPADLSQPAPPLIHDRELILRTLRDAVAQMRNVSEALYLIPVGHDYACVAHSGGTASGAVLVRVSGQKIAAMRLVKCPALLRELHTLMRLNVGGSHTSEGVDGIN